MRPLALLPLIVSAGALVMAFLCLFAGNKKGFMEDFDILKLNTSRIGDNLLDSSSSSSSNYFLQLLQNATSKFSDEVNGIEEDISSIARRIGLKDFYTMHMLDYCEGYYTPNSVPNATLPRSDIHENITYCSPDSGLFSFNATAIVQEDLNQAGLGVTLGDIDWPADINDGLLALKITTEAAFILYCIGIGFLFISFLAALFVFILPRGGRIMACLNIFVAFIAFVTIGVASACITAIMVKGVDILNKYGNEIGVAAYKGWKFMGLTWGATAAALVVMLLWCFECCCGADSRRHHRRVEARHSYEKRGHSLEQPARV